MSIENSESSGEDEMGKKKESVTPVFFEESLEQITETPLAAETPELLSIRQLCHLAGIGPEKIRRVSNENNWSSRTRITLEAFQECLRISNSRRVGNN